MSSTAFLKPAVDCVRALQKQTRRNENIFEDAKNASVASAMSMLSHTAQFIEQYINGNNQMHNINMFIACKVKKDNNPGKDATFLLWNTINETTGNARDRTISDQNPQVSIQAALKSPNADATTNPPTETPLQSNPLQQAQAQASQLPQPDETYVVPVHIASKCLQLLLDGSGFSSHKNIFQRHSYSELGSKTLEEALQKVFKAEREKRSEPEHSSSLSNTNVRSSKEEEMIYMDLLPDNLRGEEGETELPISVPKLTLSPRGDPRVSDMMKVRMNIRKPDRNKKTQNFALLCTLLDHTGPEGICAKVLNQYAKEGFTHEGCKRRRKFSTSAKSTCTGSCGLSKTQLCSFYISSSENPVGMGTVDPFVTSLDGKEVHQGSLLVRFGSMTNIDEITFPHNLAPGQRKDMYSKWQEGPTTWEKSRIERITLLGDFNKPIASAILVQDLIPAGAHSSILKRLCRTSSSKNSATDVANAIVVCDVKLSEMDDRSEPIRFPYMEWYNLPSLKALRKLHFISKEPPKFLSTQYLRTAKALLWNKEKYKRSGQ